MDFQIEDYKTTKTVEHISIRPQHTQWYQSLKTSQNAFNT